MRYFIKDYIDKINLSDIKYFGAKNDIILCDDEASILYFYLKNDWEEILYGDFSNVIHEIRERFDNSKGEKIINLFYYYKDKYKNYL